VLTTSNAGSAADFMSAVSDANGQVLFYTNGINVWNKKKAIMNNGTGLNGTISSGQSPLIVPQPNSNLYYIFTLDQWANSNGLQISIVDMALQNGFGEVVNKNKPVYSPSTEKITSYYHASENYYWIITHSFSDNEFRCYKLTETGLQSFPTISNSGSVYFGFAGQFNDAVGQLSISSDGTKLVSACYQSGTFEVHDFDINTGIVSNPKLIAGYPNAFGAEFSPDGSKLYVSRWVTSHKVWQYDLNASNWPSVLASVTLVGTGYIVGYLQLAPDGKIYVANYNNNNLGVINSPNSLGLACNYIPFGFSLLPNSSSAGLCATVKKNSLASIKHDNLISQKINVYPNPSIGNVTIQIENIKNDPLRINIINAKGQTVYNQLKYDSNNTFILEDLPSGIYCLYLTTLLGTNTKQKFIVSNN